MSRYSRRDFGKTVLGAAGSLVLPVGPDRSFAAAKPHSKVHGVQIGVQSYSFRDRPLDEAIAGMVECGINCCELWQGHVEPRSATKGKEAREELRKWRATVSLDEFKKVREKFQKAGIILYAYNYSFREDFSEEEIERGFQMAQALGVKALTASSNVSAARRVDPLAQKYKLPVGMHNHSNIRPNEFATPDDFAAAMKGMSQYIAINLDIGHFLAAGFDPVAFLQEHHPHIVTLHIKDRKKNQGENVEFGKGDTPIKEVLQVLKKGKHPIPANIEYEYKGSDTVAEVKKCLAYCKQALA